MKVSIVGGGGLVGSCAAFALQTGGLVREVDLWPKELQGLRSSAAVLRQTLDAVLKGR